MKENNNIQDIQDTTIIVTICIFLIQCFQPSKIMNEYIIACYLGILFLIWIFLENLIIKHKLIEKIAKYINPFIVSSFIVICVRISLYIIVGDTIPLVEDNLIEYNLMTILGIFCKLILLFWICILIKDFVIGLEAIKKRAEYINPIIIGIITIICVELSIYIIKSSILVVEDELQMKQLSGAFLGIVALITIITYKYVKKDIKKGKEKTKQDTYLESLLELQKLREKNIITEEEFQREKNKIKNM